MKTLGQVLMNAQRPQYKWDLTHEKIKELYEKEALAVVAAHEARKWRRVEDKPEGHGLFIVERKGMCFPYFAYWDGKHWTERGAGEIYRDVTYYQPIPLPAPPEVTTCP